MVAELSIANPVNRINIVILSSLKISPQLYSGLNVEKKRELITKTGGLNFNMLYISLTNERLL